MYCGALLQTAACPKCLGMMFAGTKFCPHCGAEATPVEVGDGLTGSCPRCAEWLTEVRVAGSRLEECTRCGGLWMPVATFNHVCFNAEAQAAATGMVLPPQAPVDPHQMYLKCPTCGDLMNRTIYARKSGVITNVCRKHGIWLDRGQLPRIIEFVRTGGLERARSAEMEELAQKHRALKFEERLRANEGGIDQV
jgi:Zn-finger nucleic acid-binding protein